MTQSMTAQTALPNSAEAGHALAAQIQQGLTNHAPDVIICFASPAHDYSALLQAILSSCRPGILIGCSSAGEFTDSAVSSSSACALALRSSALEFHAGIGRNLHRDRAAAAVELLGSFHGTQRGDSRHRYALILADALAGYTEDLLESLTLQTAAQYQFFGGGAGDDARFSRTHVFFGAEAVTDAVVGLEILSDQPLGIGVGHGWQPATPALRVTQAEATQLNSLNAIPAAEVFEEYAAEASEPFNAADPLPFFLHHVLGIRTEQGYKLRVPLAINADQSVSCAADVPTGSTVSIMSIEEQATGRAAAEATRSALRQLGGQRPAAALFFDCAATRLRMGQQFGGELEQVAAVLGPVPFAGCNTYGQIARAEGQFSGFHNCTAVVCIIPE